MLCMYNIPYTTFNSLLKLKCNFSGLVPKGSGERVRDGLVWSVRVVVMSMFNHFYFYWESSCLIRHIYTMDPSFHDNECGLFLLI